MMPALALVTRLDTTLSPADTSFVRDLRGLAGPTGAGRKAATLAALVSAHLPVPPAIVVDLSTWPLSERRVEELKAKTRALLRGGVAVVRTSGAGRGGGAAVGGRLDSVSDVRTFDELLCAAERCRAIWLEDARPGPSAGPVPGGPHVVVQRQVDPLISGFVARSLAGSRDSTATVTIDYAAGSIEAMAAGWIDPGRVRVGLRDGAITTLCAWPDGQSQTTLNAHLTPRRLVELARLCVTAEAVLGQANTVEWAIDHLGTLWVLAARPTVTARRPDAGEPAAAPEPVPARAARQGAAGRTQRSRWPAVRIVLRLPRPGSAVTLGLATG